MKKLIGFSLFLALMGAAPAAMAQEKAKEAAKDVKEAGKAVKKGAKKTGRKTAEVASKGKARVTDSEHKDKVGPNGETIYIDNHARYYWVDKRGRRHYLKSEELKDRVDN